MDGWLRAVEDGALAETVRTSAWLYPTLQVGHLLAMAALVGFGAVLDARHNRVELVCSQIGGVVAPLAPRWDLERLQRVFLEQVAAKALDVSRLVTHVIPVTQVADAYRLLDRNQGQVLQVVFEFPKE